jgi:hypothetical protein
VASGKKKRSKRQSSSSVNIPKKDKLMFKRVFVSTILFVLMVFVAIGFGAVFSHDNSETNKNIASKIISKLPSTSIAEAQTASAAVFSPTISTTSASFSKHPYSGKYKGGKIPKDGTPLTAAQRTALIKNGHPHWGSSLVKVPDVDLNDVPIKNAFDKFVLDALTLEKYSGALSEKMKSSSVYAIKGFDVSETQRVTESIARNIYEGSVGSNVGDIAHDNLSNRINAVGGRTNSLWGSHHASDKIIVKMVTDKTTGRSGLLYMDGTDAPHFVLVAGNMRGAQRGEVEKLIAVQFNPNTHSWTIFKCADINANTVIEDADSKEMIITLYPDVVNLKKSMAKKILRNTPYYIEPRLINTMDWREK